MIVGIAGPYAAGKGEVVRLLVERGFEAWSLSDSIRLVLAERGLEESRERMIETGRELRRSGGPGVLAERLLATLAPDGRYAIDSIRNPAEVDALRDSGRPFVLLWVDADEGTRFLRLRERGRSGDPRSLEELRDLEGRELRSDDPAGQQLLAVRDQADATLRNDGDLEALRTALESVLSG